MGYRILVAEDSDSMRHLICSTLRGEGYKTIEAMDGEDAIKQLEENDVDLVISDLKMPKIDGMELLKYLRSHELFKSLPVVMLTTESQYSKVIEAKNAGINSWIIKPFAPAKLLGIVKRLLQ